MDSRQFVQRAYGVVRRAGWRVGNVDTTVIADGPRLGPYKARIRKVMSQLLQVQPTAVSVKAKTTEQLSPGRHGIAAQAVVLLRRRAATRRAKT